MSNNNEKIKLPAPDALLPLIPEGISLDLLRSESILPIAKDEERLVVAISSIEKYSAATMLGVGVALPVEIEMYPEDDIQERIHALYELRSEATDDAARAMEGIDEDLIIREDVLSDSIDVPVIKLVNGLIMDAIKQRATDIHVEPYEENVIVRFRIDGVLRDRLKLPRTHQAPLTSRIKVMARMDIAEHMAPQDGRIAVNVAGRAVDIRVGGVPTQYGERMALRILDKGSGVLTLEQLGMAEAEASRMEYLISNPHGMILFTGPTGSGKTTSLYAILQKLASPDVNVITVEDPIEYDLPGVAQIQVNEKADVTFASALRAILRQDPDIVMVGEMRDFETAHIGVQASLTGHLVLSTLHTNDSISAILRLSDMGVPSYLVAGSLLGVVAQRLVRRLCPHCKREVEAPPILQKSGVTRAYTAVGCSKCHETGFYGRQGIYEQFLVDDNIRMALMRDAPPNELKELAAKTGFRTIWEIGVDLVKSGVTSPEELLRVAGEMSGA